MSDEFVVEVMQIDEDFDDVDLDCDYEEEEQEEQEEVDDILREFEELSEEGEYSNVVEGEVEAEERPFTRYLLPFIQIIDNLCSKAPFFFNYMCVLIDDKGGRERGLKRLIYFCNSGDANYVSSFMLAYRALLIGKHCRLDRNDYLGLLDCIKDDSHKGHENDGQNDVRQRLEKLDNVLAFLDASDGVVNYDYSDIIRAIAIECNVELVERPLDGEAERVEALPYFVFYEFCQQNGNRVYNKRESAGFSSHSDFPAMRLLRLMWRNDGCVAEARQMYENEQEGEDLQRDAMYHLLIL